MMLAAFATLAFLATIWLTVVALAATLDGSAAKILAALSGRSMLSEPPQAMVTLRFSQRVPARQAPTRRAEPQWRAAA